MNNTIPLSSALSGIYCIQDIEKERKIKEFNKFIKLVMKFYNTSMKKGLLPQM